MPELASRTLFSGGDVLHPNDLGNAEVANFGNNIDNRLREHYKWKGSALGVVGLTLSSDNERIIGGLFITRGVTKFKEQKVSCNFIWPDSTPNIILAVTIPHLDVFTFEAGGLWSEIVPSQKIVHSFHGADGCVVLADERNRLGVGDFSVRMVCQLSSSSDGRKGVVMKFAILLFPASAAELDDVPESKFPGWPGIQLYEGTFPVGPKPTVPWQCPILPFVRPGVTFDELPTAPSGKRLRHAVAAVMRKAGQPDTLANGGEVLEKWATIRTNPRALVSILPVTTWPAVEASPEPEGKIFLSLLILCQLPSL